MKKEKKQFIMTMTSIQYADDEKTESVLDTEIEYYRDDDGDRVISYAESEATGMEGSVTQVRVSSGNMVSILRTGNFQTHLVVQTGRKHFCHYETPFGDFAVGVAARWVDNHLTDDGGSLTLRYTVDANSTLLSDNEIRVAVRKLSV